MPKAILLLLLGPFVLAAAVLVSPFACLYFSFSRFCDLIEEFKPIKAGKSKAPNPAQQLGKILSLIPTRGNYHS